MLYVSFTIGYSRWNYSFHFFYHIPLDYSKRVNTKMMNKMNRIEMLIGSCNDERNQVVDLLAKKTYKFNLLYTSFRNHPIWLMNLLYFRSITFYVYYNIW